jgi:uncharacterized protein YacL
MLSMLIPFMSGTTGLGNLPTCNGTGASGYCTSAVKSAAATPLVSSILGVVIVIALIMVVFTILKAMREHHRGRPISQTLKQVGGSFIFLIAITGVDAITTKGTGIVSAVLNLISKSIGG